jgi:predicted dehydrogenase
MEAGIPVLSEKPLAGTLEDAQAIVNTANKTGVLHMVAQNYRYTALAQTAKSVLDSGELGDIGSISVSFFKGPHFGGFRELMLYPLIIDMSIHHFDMMRFLLGHNAKEIYARSWNPSWSWYKGDACATVSILFDNGITASYNGSWCSQGMETTWNANWRFECANGILAIEDDAIYIQRQMGLENVGTRQHIKTDEKSLVPLVPMSLQAQDYLLQEFYEAVTSNKTPKTTAQDNIHTMQFVFNTIRACETGGIIRS